MHKLSERVILQHLLKGGLVKGDVDAMMQANLCSMFMPHGLGHFIGLNVHDVGGYPAKGEKKDTDTPGLKWLRTNRVVEQGMVLTVEPGPSSVHVSDSFWLFTFHAMPFVLFQDATSTPTILSLA